MSVTSVLAASPGELRAAAGRLSSAAHGLSSRSVRVQGAGEIAGNAWSGIAASTFRSHCSRLSSDGRTGSQALARAGDALSELANSLEYAQQLARESRSLAASAASLRSQASSMEPSPMIRLVTEEAHAVAGRSAALEAEADRIAREAAARAASVLRETASSAPSHKDGGWGGVMNLNASDLTAYLNLDASALPDRVQALVGKQLAEMLRTATADGWSESEVAMLFDAIETNAHDGDFAAAFFNEYGSRATVTLVEDLQERYGYFTSESERFTEPLSIALGSASRSGDLAEGFVDDLVDPATYGMGMLETLAQLVEHGTYSTDFAVTLGDHIVKRIAHDPTAHGNWLPGEDGVPIDLHSVILHAVARTPDAARELLLMRLDDDHFSHFGHRDYMDLLMSADFMGPDSGVGALITAATVDAPAHARDDAAQIVLKFITRGPEMDATHGLPTDVVRAAGTVAAEWWREFANIAYKTSIGAEWTQVVAAGEVTDNGRIHVSMNQAVAFLGIGVSDDAGRAEMERAMIAHRDELIAKALDMPPGDARDHVMHRMGASVEAFSIADSMDLEADGIDADTGKAIERQIAGLLIEPVLSKTGHLGLPLGIGLDAILDEAFQSEEQARGIKKGSLNDIRQRLELKLEVIDEAVERGLIPKHELRSLMRFLAMQGQSEFDGIRHVTDLMDTEGLDTVMDGLRGEYWYEGGK